MKLIKISLKDFVISFKEKNKFRIKYFKLFLLKYLNVYFRSRLEILDSYIVISNKNETIFA